VVGAGPAAAGTAHTCVSNCRSESRWVLWLCTTQLQLFAAPLAAPALGGVVVRLAGQALVCRRHAAQRPAAGRSFRWHVPSAFAAPTSPRRAQHRSEAVSVPTCRRCSLLTTSWTLSRCVWLGHLVAARRVESAAMQPCGRPPARPKLRFLDPQPLVLANTAGSSGCRAESACGAAAGGLCKAGSIHGDQGAGKAAGPGVRRCRRCRRACLPLL